MLRIDPKKFKPYITESPLENQLIESFATLKTKEEIGNFLRDILSNRELQEMSHRIEVAKLLLAGHTYLEIAKKLGVSTTTITRTAQWLTTGHGGYYTVLKRLGLLPKA